MSKISSLSKKPWVRGLIALAVFGLLGSTVAGCPKSKGPVVPVITNLAAFNRCFASGIHTTVLTYLKGDKRFKHGPVLKPWDDKVATIQQQKTPSRGSWLVQAERPYFEVVLKEGYSMRSLWVGTSAKKLQRQDKPEDYRAYPSYHETALFLPGSKGATTGVLGKRAVLGYGVIKAVVGKSCGAAPKPKPKPKPKG
jgi:hypothetical protein